MLMLSMECSATTAHELDSCAVPNKAIAWTVDSRKHFISHTHCDPVTCCTMQLIFWVHMSGVIEGVEWSGSRWDTSTPSGGVPHCNCPQIFFQLQPFSKQWRLGLGMCVCCRRVILIHFHDWKSFHIWVLGHNASWWDHRQLTKEAEERQCTTRGEKAREKMKWTMLWCLHTSLQAAQPALGSISVSHRAENHFSNIGQTSHRPGNGRTLACNTAQHSEGAHQGEQHLKNGFSVQQCN